jgi:hypothetical protein
MRARLHAADTPTAADSGAYGGTGRSAITAALTRQSSGKMSAMLQADSVNYAKARYGPYAENLNHVLQALEGHYLRGYGDRTQDVLKLSPIALLADAEDESQRWLVDHPDRPPTGSPE